MKAIILAAGKGSRLGKYTEGKPKCLLALGEESVLSREIRILQECGLKAGDIYVVGGYKYKLLEPIAPNLIYNSEYDTKDNSYSLGIAMEAVPKDDILILDADLCFEKELILEILNDPHENVLLSKEAADMKESTGIVAEESGRVKAIGKQYHNTGYVYISIFKIGKEVVSELMKILLSERSEHTWYTYAITEMCGENAFYNKVTKQKWHEIDFIEDYIETLEMFQLGER